MSDSSSAAIPALLERLQSWLKKHRPRFAAALNPSATSQELSELEKHIGRPVPQPLRDLLTWHNGQRPGFVGGFEQDWLFMSSAGIADAKRPLDADAAETGWKPTWLPFLDNDAGDYLCLDAAAPACPVRAFWLGNKEHAVMSPSLAAWLRDFVINVENGAYVEEPERGTFLRRGK